MGDAGCRASTSSTTSGSPASRCRSRGDDEHLHAILCDIVQAERTLLFSSDYPHWDFDSPRHALTAIPAEMRRRVEVDNAVETYGARL